MLTSGVLVSEKHKALVLPWRQDLANLLPHARATHWQGAAVLVLPHTLEEVRLCWNLGVQVPAPVLHYYDFPAPLGQPAYAVQKSTVALMTTNRRAYNLNSFGTGKTRCTIWSFDYLRRNLMANRMLVIAPLSTLDMTWRREVFRIAPHLSVAVLHGSAERRRKLLAQDHDIYVINHDGVEILGDLLAKRVDIDVVAIDELAVYRNGRADRSKSLAKVLAAKPPSTTWVWGLTGAPTPNTPTDAWAQAKLVTPWTAGKSFVHFREQVMLKVSNFRWVPKPAAIETVHKMLQPAVRYTLDDVVEMPEQIFQHVDVGIGPAQEATYARLRDHMHMLLAEGAITALNEAVLMNKLLQVSLGWVYTNDRGIVHLDNSPRLQALSDDLAAAERKVLVFVPFVHALNGLTAFIRSKGYTVEAVSGETSKAERDRIFHAFQSEAEPRIIAAHPGCMAHGLTLTAADTIIWFGPFPSLDIFDQANARIRRIGQRVRQLVRMYQGTRVEQKLYARLQQKQAAQGLLLDLFEKESV